MSPRKEGAKNAKAGGPAKAGPKGAAKAAGAKAPPSRGKARAIWAFEALNPDEMDLQVGDVVNLTNDDSADWWIGELRGKVGAFPASYVVRI